MLNFQFCAAISVIPSARLLETSPKGWQSTGSYEDKNYTKLQKSIQEEDFCPILNFHYQLLTKSEYDKVYDFDCVFNDIDTPTEKERAEIREINSRTDSNYINSGVISPDEVRDVLRQDPNSGYSALSEEAPDDIDIDLDVGEENNNGGRSTEQDPFSQDDKDFKESEHPRDEDGKFSKSSSSTVNSQENKAKNIVVVSNPAYLSGAKRTHSMTFKEANGGKVNPNYKLGGGYLQNCQACVAVFEARMRGYNIEAKPYNHKIMGQLSFRPNLAYKDINTNEPPQILHSKTKNPQELKKWLNETIQPDERYAMNVYRQGDVSSHLITVFKDPQGKLTFYDPQNGKKYNDGFLKSLVYEYKVNGRLFNNSPYIFRIDNTELNSDIFEKIAKPAL